MPESMPVVAVVGATGHTARFVVEELLRRKMKPIAVARDSEALAKASFSGEVVRRRAKLNDPESLDSALEGANALINCAGPFIDSARDVAAAALRAGIHYVDITAEEPSARSTLKNYDTAARQRGIAVVPSVGFYGALGDLLTTAALDDWESAETVELAIGLDSWHPTLGTRKTIARLSDLQKTDASGAPSQPRRAKVWDFGKPLGQQPVVEFSFTERLLILRHVRTSDLRTYLSEIALGHVSDPLTPTPKAVDEVGRSAQRFVVEALVTRGLESRRATARGVDAYAITAPLACEVVARMIDGSFSHTGAHAPGEIFDGIDILTALSPDSLTFELAESR